MAAKNSSKAKKSIDQTVDEDIASGSIRPVYLLFGEETYLLRQKKKLLLDAVRNPDDNMNFSTFEGKGIRPAEIIDLAETLPFLAERRVLLVENSGFFKNAAPNELVEYIDVIPEAACLIFAESDVDKRGRLYKAVSKKGAAVEYNRLDQDTLSKWIASRIRKEGKQISRDTLERFLIRSGDNMEFIDCELEKLLSYTVGRDAITNEDLNAICSGQMTDDIFAMVNAFSAHDRKTAFTLYYRLLENRESPYHILFLVIRQLNLLMQIRDLAGRHLGTREIAERMGSPDWLVRKNLAQANGFSLETLKNAVKDGVEAEEAFKSGRLTEHTAVELFLTKYS